MYDLSLLYPIAHISLYIRTFHYMWQDL